MIESAGVTLYCTTNQILLRWMEAVLKNHTTDTATKTVVKQHGRGRLQRMRPRSKYK